MDNPIKSILINLKLNILGGSRTCNFGCYILDHKYGSMSDYKTFVNYLSMASPINQTVEGRMTFIYEEGEEPSFAPAFSPTNLFVLASTLTIILYSCINVI